MINGISLDIIPESTKEEALNPSANLIGQAVRGVLHLALDPLVKLNIVRNQSLKDFEEQIQNKNEAIPIENRDSSKFGLALKALEDSKYQLDSEQLREMFATLISSTLDNRTNSIVQPSFSTVLKDLSPEDAIILLKFVENKKMPLVKLRFEIEDGGTGVDVFDNILLFNDEIIYNPISISSLERLGILSIDSSKLQSKKNLEIYTAFESSSLYKSQEQRLPIVNEEFTLSKMIVNECSIELTPFGEAFISVIV